MNFSCIVACDELGGIGIGNKLPWSIPADLAHFKKVTDGKPVIMGKNTYQSLAAPLPNRLNIVVSTSLEEVQEGAVIVDSIDLAKYLAELTMSTQSIDEAFVIGGPAIYEAFEQDYTTVYLTKVEGVFETDTKINTDFFFKDLEDKEVWNSELLVKSESSVPPYKIIKYTRIKSSP